MIKVAVDKSVEQMTNVKRAASTGGVRVTDDVYRTAVGQQVVEFRTIRKVINPVKIDQQQPTNILDRCVEMIEINRLPAIIGAHADKVAFVSHHVDQLELLEERGERIEA